MSHSRSPTEPSSSRLLPFAQRVALGTTAISLALGAAIGFFSLTLSSNGHLLGQTAQQVMVVLVTLTGVAVGATLPHALRVARRPGEGALLMCAVFGTTYLCVPETDQYRSATTLVVVFVAAELVLRRQLPIAFYGVLGAVIAWTSVFGATGRVSAYLGALFAWWAVMLIALVDAAIPIRGPRSVWAVGLVGAATVVGVARTGGVSDSNVTAVVSIAIAVPVSLLVAVVLARGLRSAAD